MAPFAAPPSLLSLALLVLLGSLLVGLPATAGLDIFNPGWTAGQATFYPDAAKGGQCRYFGYYGNAIVAIGNEYWANGGACGSCFELQCDPSNNGNGNSVYSSGCRPGLPVLKVTLSDITDECYSDGCGNTGYHFDLDPSKYAEFANFAADGGGIVFIKWRRVPCDHGKNLALRAHEQTNPWWLAFTVLDQNGAGDIDHVEWSSATRGWQIAPRLGFSGNTFTIGGYPYEPMSVRITTLRGDQVTLPGCLPGQPSAGQTYTCTTNFPTQGSPPALPAPVPPTPVPPPVKSSSGGSNVCASLAYFPTQCFFNRDSTRYVCCDGQGCNGFNSDNVTPNCKNNGYVPPNFGAGAPPSVSPPGPSPPQAPAGGSQGLCGTGPATNFPNRCWFNSDPSGRYVCCDGQGCDGFNSDNLTPHCKNYGYVPPRFGT